MEAVQSESIKAKISPWAAPAPRFLSAPGPAPSPSDPTTLAPTKIIKANASEICALAGVGSMGRGVDSDIAPQRAKEILAGHGRPGVGGSVLPDQAAELLGSASVLVISGQTDVVISKNRTVEIANGSELMGAVTGTGCILSAICAAFYAVAQDDQDGQDAENAQETFDAFDAAVAAVAVTGIAGQLAGQKAKGPGFFLGHFMDSLYHLDERAICDHLNIREGKEVLP